jgi:HAD domain in Swiss Army Knife RNA repair proteins
VRRRSTPTAPSLVHTRSLPSANMRIILFLDFDGVLHPVGGGPAGSQFSRCRLLEDLLREPALAAVRIVISSTWREAYSLARLRQVFAPDLRERVIDVTPELPEHHGPHGRHREIQVWLAGHPEVAHWVAVDDSRSQFPPGLDMHAVFTDPRRGLTGSDIERLRALLDAAHPA